MSFGIETRKTDPFFYGGFSTSSGEVKGFALNVISKEQFWGKEN